MRRTELRRLMAGAAWTLALSLGLWGLDRLTLGPPAAEGWRLVAVVAEVSPEAGPVPVPPYLPEGLAWPPSRVFEQRTPLPGWWVEIAPEREGGPQMWLGSLPDPPPSMPTGAARCFATGPGATCPRPWRLLSSSPGRLGVLHMVTTLEPTEARRVLAGFERRWGQGKPSPSLEP